MRIIVLFNLKAGADLDAYEKWAQTSDIPAVRAMKTASEFRVLKATGLLGSDAPSPYQYIETIDISAVEPFLEEASTDTAQKIAAEFQEFADQPMFILTEDL